MDYLNIIIDNGNAQAEDKELLFGDEEVFIIPPNTSIYELLLRLGSFISLGQAKKNWKGPTQIPEGWSEVSVGIWNPVPSNKWGDTEWGLYELEHYYEDITFE
jgi:hypothetical protein